MLKPETIRKLQTELPELQELRDHLVEEARKLNTLEAIESVTTDSIAVEVLARLRAYDTIKAILAPIVDVANPLTRSDPKEYAVEVP